MVQDEAGDVPIAARVGPGSDDGLEGMRLPHFTKLHGLGNDYLVIEPSSVPFALTPAAVRLICHRNLGVGADGVLVTEPPVDGCFPVRIYNPDGSEAEKSGNGVRILAKYLYDRGRTHGRELVIGTRGGDVPVRVEPVEGRVRSVTANMGRAAVYPQTGIELDGQHFSVVPVSIGNPHCVIVVESLASVDITGVGPRLERHNMFTNRTNVQFVEVLSRRRVRVLIWERGAGVTLASGSSSCAVAAACRQLGLTDEEIDVEMPGGSLRIELRDDEAWMTGAVEEVCEGDLSPDLLHRLSMTADIR